MNLTQADFPSRLSLRATALGSLVVTALMTMLMTLAGGMGLWRMEVQDLARLSTVFWIWTFLAAAVSVYAGGYIAAFTGKCETERDGALHGLAVWSMLCVLGGALLLINGEGVFSGLPESVTSPRLFGLFFAELLTLGVAVAGGIRGAALGSTLEAFDSKRFDRHVLTNP